MHNKPAYSMLLPCLAIMTISGVIPLGFVLFYSVHDSFSGNDFIWVGLHWYQQILSSPDFLIVLGRSLAFSALALAMQIPLGIYIALRIPASGLFSNLALGLLAIPLLTPSILVGYIWKILTVSETALIPSAVSLLGFSLDMNNPVTVWAVLLLMDTWHWTSLVVLLCFAGLRAIPDAYFQAARIDGANSWAIFRHIQLPRIKLVLLIAIMLRFMDSFMIYTEPYVVTRGGPGVSTTFLSHELVQTSTIQFDLGEGGAMAIIYYSIVLAVAWAFYRIIVPPEKTAGEASP